VNSLPYLDIHTHRREQAHDCINVECLSVEELIGGRMGTQHVTAGIHPWWLEDYTHEEIAELRVKVESLAAQGVLWGIGETGLDRTMPDLMSFQKELFIWHMNLAQKHHLPLVIHNVRSGSDFLEILKDHKATTPWIFHDFRGNEALMKDLIRLHPDCYFSFGISIDNSPQVRELLPFVPLEHLFLETDDQKHLDIHDIFIRAAHRLGVDEELLKSQLWINFKKVSRITH